MYMYFIGFCISAGYLPRMYSIDACAWHKSRSGAMTPMSKLENLLTYFSNVRHGACFSFSKSSTPSAINHQPDGPSAMARATHLLFRQSS